MFFKVSPFDNYLNQKHTLQAKFPTKRAANNIKHSTMKFYYYPRQKYVPCSRVQRLYLYILKAAGHFSVEWRANYFNMLPFSDMIKKNRKLKFVLGPSTTFWYIQNFIRLETETSPRVYSRKLRTNRFLGTFMIELVDYIVFSCSTPTDNKKIVFSVFLSLCSKECGGISGR